MANEKADVVIVGSGASGSTFAAVLAKAGKKVVVLEQGPDWQLSDLISSDFWGRRIKPAGGPFLLEGKNPVSYGYQGGWGVGGAALHYFANFPRLLPNDFKIKSEHGRAMDWPISYSDVAPFYDKVAKDIGVSGDAKAEEKWRPAGDPYPMPPMKTFRNGDIWLKGFEAVGIKMVPAAVGMNSVEYKGRAAHSHVSTYLVKGSRKSILIDTGLTWRLHEAGRFSGHSGRVGLYVSATEAGVPAQHIAALARHKSMAIVLRYAQQADLLACSPHAWLQPGN